MLVDYNTWFSGQSNIKSIQSLITFVILPRKSTLDNNESSHQHRLDQQSF